MAIGTIYSKNGQTEDKNALHRIKEKICSKKAPPRDLLPAGRVGKGQPEKSSVQLPEGAGVTERISHTALNFPYKSKLAAIAVIAASFEDVYREDTYLLRAPEPRSLLQRKRPGKGPMRRTRQGIPGRSARRSRSF